MTVWVSGEDFIALVGAAMKDRRSATAAMMRDRLAGPEIIDETVEALETIVDRIDAHLGMVGVPEDVVARREKARAGMYDSLVWFRQLQAFVEADVE